MLKIYTCLQGKFMVLISSDVFGLICRRHPPSKTATHKFPSVSIVIPSGTPGILCFSKLKIGTQLPRIDDGLIFFYVFCFKPLNLLISPLAIS